MGKQEAGLSGLTKTICVDLSQTTELLPRTEFRLSDLLVGDWFRQQAGFKLPILAEKLGINQEKMQVAGDRERHLMIFKSQDGLSQVLIKYGVSYKNDQKSWFPTAVGVSGLDNGRLVATAWRLLNSSKSREEQVWIAATGAISYKEDIQNDQFIGSSTAPVGDEAKMFRLPWFTEEMLALVNHSRALEVKDRSIWGSGMVFGDTAICKKLRLSIIRMKNSYVILSTREKDPWQFTIEKKLEPDLV